MLWIFRYIKTSGDNFHEVVPGRIYRSATPSPENLEKWYRKFGVRTWLDLRLAKDLEGDRARNFAAQMAICKRLGIERVWVPISDRNPTSDLDVQRCLDVLTDLSRSAVLVACQGGRHRTGLVCALYRVRVQGWKSKDAFKEAEKHGFYDAMGHGDFGKRFRQLLSLLLVLLMAVPAFGQSVVKESLTAHPFIKPDLASHQASAAAVDRAKTLAHPQSDVYKEDAFNWGFWVASSLWGAAVTADIVTTKRALERGAVEQNPIFAHERGHAVRYTANAIASTGIWGVAAYAEHRGHRRFARVLLLTGAVIRTCAAVWNYNRARN